MNQRPSMRSAWGLLIFLTGLNVLNFVDRQLIVNLAPMLTSELNLRLTDVAWLYGYVFLVFYTVMGLVMAVIADRWHRQRLIAGGLAVWSALTSVSGAATGFLHLALARMLVGVGEATLTPAALSILSDAFPTRNRALATGIYYSGVSLGTGMSLIIVGQIAPVYGWRACFYLLGILGLVLTPFVLLIRTPPRGAAESMPASGPASGPAGSQSIGEIYRSLISTLRRTPAMGWTIAAAVLLNFSTSAGSLAFTWLVRERGMDFRRTGTIYGIIVVIVGLVGTSGSGALSDWCHRRWAGGRLWFLIAKAFCLAPFVLGFYTLAIDAPYGLFHICWFFAVVSSLSWYGPIFATVQDLAPVKIRATAIAFLMLAINIIGTGLGPLVAARIGDAHSLWRGLIICSAIGYTSLIPLLLAARRYQIDLSPGRND
ncbi:MAG: MFS transporter [Blastocatellia bacterium]|nr:MFS transporter [Blastocatellia bacterium]